MKRNIILCALALTALLLSGCSQQQSRMEYIGAEKAKQLALEAAGVSSAEAVTADLTSRNGLDYYQVDVTAEGRTYQYDIDALTGVVIDTQAPNNPAEDSQAAADAGSAIQPVQTTPAPPAGGGANTITAEEAKEKALAHAGLTSDQVTFVKSKLDYENGRQVYDVEFYTGDRQEYDYEIDAATGEVVSFDYDAKGSSPTPSGSTLTEEQAKELALAQVPGASSGDIQKFKTDYDDGRMEYEGKIVYDGMEYEFEIDAYSGAFRSWEAEPAGR